ncbi:ribosome maturation factor RimM [Szabonella alba]|uniref:Ribosome maturation factor RimM n=1 Tax=Szabonella alba TaxID=2804194 RepID=A0A8K0Y0Z2_9RHOB|nr:ribosome maturation factor RimM [Szabonella alba]MBL4918735.1 16S rRNA processing protein RimM [Szabonella alba]
MTNPTPESLICVGAIAGSFGVQGEVRIKSFCAQPEAIAAYSPLYTEDGTRSFTLRLTRQVTGGFGARMSGIATKEEADALKGTSLYALRDKMPNLPDDEFYHADLIGLDVFDTGGAAMGRVTAVHNHGAGDLLEIAGTGRGDSVLIPFTLQAVPTVDLGSRRIIVDPPAED